jgi:hypothetical protein
MTLQSDETRPAMAACFQFPEAVRLLWEGTQKAVAEWGIDRRDLVSLCDVIVHLADHRLMVIEACGSPTGSEQVVDQVHYYRKLAFDLLRWAAEAPPDPAWNEVAQKLNEEVSAPLDLRAHPKV